MVRTRTTVKPGLLLQAVVLDQLGGALVADVIAESGLTGGEFAVASWLNIRERATPSELATDLGMAPTTLSSIIERLVRKGQVKRVPNPEDGRSYLLQLTAGGKATNAANAARFQRMITRVRAELDRDEEEILEAMRALEAAMRRALGYENVAPAGATARNRQRAPSRGQR
jgi:DNA-binding MarR family transcriptional regulator